MKFTRKAVANWKGGKNGKGNLTTDSGVLNETAYSFKMRFENERGTNPEELIGAAHAGCFTMKLSILLEEAGFTPVNLETKAGVTFENGMISLIHLDLTAEVPEISEEQFQELANKAKETCPVSMSLKSEITLFAVLAAKPLMSN